MIKLGLGGVQLGVAYGARSHLPPVSSEQAKAILELAAERGFLMVDTAMAYGSSEERIGSSRVLHRYPNFSVSTKPPAVDASLWGDAEAFFKFLRLQLKESRERLQISALDLLQFHQCTAEFLSSAAVRDVMGRLLSEGECARIGISVYQPEQAELALTIPAVSVLQIPVNLLDLRFVTSSLISKYKQRGVELIARSVFFQGILIESCEIPQVRPAERLLSLKREAVQIAARFSRTLVDCAVGYVFGNLREQLDLALVGANSTLELEQAIAWVANAKPLSTEEMAAFTPVREKFLQEDLLDPAKWLL